MIKFIHQDCNMTNIHYQNYSSSHKNVSNSLIISILNSILHIQQYNKYYYHIKNIQYMDVPQLSSAPAFQFLQKRRLKVAEMHRSRRQELFNRSRQMFEYEGTQDKHSEEAHEQVEGSYEQGEQSAIVEVDNSQDLVSVEQNQINQEIQAICLDSNSIQEPTIQPQPQSQQKHHNSNSNKHKHQSPKKPNINYSKFLQIPSWLITIPEQLHNYYAMARPNGKNCLLVFTQSWVHIYDKFNRKQTVNISQNEHAVVKKLAQHLEGTILQITYVQEPSQMCYVTDLLHWKNTTMTAQNFQFRYSWLLANFNKVQDKCGELGFKLVQYLPMDTKENLVKVYMGNYGYQKQGLLFMFKDAPYIHGFNQNVLIWKDQQTSKYPIDQPIHSNSNSNRNNNNHNNNNNKMEESDQHKKNINYIYGTGKLRKNGFIYSLDGYKLGLLNSSIILNNWGGFIKFRLTSIKFNTSQTNQKQHSQMSMQDENTKDKQSDLKVILQNFKVIQYKKFGRAQPLSRIIFQYRMRYDPLTIQNIYSRLGLANK